MEKLDLCGGNVARVTGLVGRTDLNGRKCRLLSWNQNTERWAVDITDEKVLIKPENLLSLGNEDLRKKCNIRPQDVRGRLDYLASTGGAMMTADAAISEYTAIVDLLTSNRKLKRLQKIELSDAHSARSSFLLGIRNNQEAKDDATKAIQIDPKNDSAYYNRAMCLINEENFTAAIDDLSMVISLSAMVDITCLVKRSYCHSHLRDLKSCVDDMDTAQDTSIQKASLLSEFVPIHKYIAGELLYERKIPLAISGLSKALLAIPNERASAPLLIRRCQAYLMAVNPSSFQTDLDKARCFKYECEKDSELIKYLLSYDGKVGRTTFFKFSHPLERPVGAFLQDVANYVGEHERYQGQRPAERAREMLLTLGNTCQYVSTDATEGDYKRLWDLATLEEAGSRFAEEVYHQSDGLRSVTDLICSRETSYEERSLALRILRVVATSGNRRLCKVLLTNASLMNSLLLLIKSCSAEVVAGMAPIHHCPSFRIPIHVPDIYRTGVLAEQAVDLLQKISFCASKKFSLDLVDMGMINVFQDMLVAYKSHWVARLNEGEGILLSNLMESLLVSIDHLRCVSGVAMVTLGNDMICRKGVRDLTRAGQRCSNPDCPKTQEVSSYLDQNTRLHRCSRCNINQYCSRECQHQHWPAHKVDCQKERGYKMEHID